MDSFLTPGNCLLYVEPPFAKEKSIESQRVVVKGLVTDVKETQNFRTMDVDYGVWQFYSTKNKRSAHR